MYFCVVISFGSREGHRGHVPLPPICLGVKKIREDLHCHDYTGNLVDIYVTSELSYSSLLPSNIKTNTYPI